MVPAMVASAIATLIATPAGGATVAGITLSASEIGAITGSALIGLSAMGNAKHQALVGGADTLAANVYGIFIGSSEALLGYFLGNIPGISQSAGFTLSGLLQEGTEEYLQEWIEAGLQAIILGQDVDWSEVPVNATKSFFMGVLMSGFLNGGQAIVNITINGASYNINVENILNYMEAHPDIDVMEAVEVLEPGLFDAFRRRANRGTLTVDKINAEISRIAGNNIGKIPDAIGSMLTAQFNSTRNDADLRLICQTGISYMMANGYTRQAAVNIIGALYTKTLQSVGFDTYYDPQTGIKLNILKGINWQNQAYNPNSIMAQLANLPKEFTALIKEINFYDTFNPYDFYWENEYQMADFHSAATGGNGQINFWTTSFSDVTTVVHEIAHTYDTAMASSWGVETARISDSRMWLDAMAADQQINGLNGVSEYARSSNSPHEDFAEAVAMFYTNPNALDAFPNRKRILMQFMPQTQTIATTYDAVYTILVNKYGVAEAELRLKKYYETGNIKEITRDGGARGMISQYTLSEFRQFMDQAEMIRINDKKRAVENSFNLCMNALINKYGLQQAIKQMQAFINTGKVNFITSSEGARSSITYSVEEYRLYLKTINHGSLDVAALYGSNGGR
jgi:hypothetical protein